MAGSELRRSEERRAGRGPTGRSRLSVGIEVIQEQYIRGLSSAHCLTPVHLIFLYSQKDTRRRQPSLHPPLKLSKVQGYLTWKISFPHLV